MLNNTNNTATKRSMYSYFITDLFLGVHVTKAYQLYYSQYLFCFRFAYKTYSGSWTSRV